MEYIKLTEDNVNLITGIEWVNKSEEKTGIVRTASICFGKNEKIDNTFGKGNYYPWGDSTAGISFGIPTLTFGIQKQIVEMKTVPADKGMLKAVVVDILENYTYENNWDMELKSSTCLSVINGVSNSIFESTHFSPANYLIMNEKTLDIFRSREIDFDGYNIFTSDYCPEDKIILGFKDANHNENTGYRILRTPEYTDENGNVVFDVWSGMTIPNSFGIVNILNRGN